MADVAKPVAESDAPVHKPRPEKPDEEQYKAELAKAEKEHATVQEELVRYLFHGPWGLEISQRILLGC